jgi:predicted nuclease with TOPRIM domain
MCTDRQEIILKRQGYYAALRDHWPSMEDKVRLSLVTKAFPLPKKIVPTRIKHNGFIYEIDAYGALVRVRDSKLAAPHIVHTPRSMRVIRELIANPTIEVDDDGSS